MIDILYVAKNRLEFTKLSMQALIENTNWELVQHLFLVDDGSIDHTQDYLLGTAEALTTEIPITLRLDDLVGGPIAAMNWYLDYSHEDEGSRFVKIDNDVVVCPGWLDELAEQVTMHPEVDVFGILPNTLGAAVAPPDPRRGLLPASHIGGVGLIRRRIFNVCRPVPNGRYGWTEFQTEHRHVNKAWLDPAMPCFELDKLPFEPYTSLVADYVERGWQRQWPPYDPSSTSYWDWFVKETV